MTYAYSTIVIPAESYCVVSITNTNGMPQDVNILNAINNGASIVEFLMDPVLDITDMITTWVCEEILGYIS